MDRRPRSDLVLVRGGAGIRRSADTAHQRGSQRSTPRVCGFLLQALTRSSGRSERRYSHQGSPVSEARRVFNRAETSTAVSGGRGLTAEARSLYRPHSR
ncbi:hypothetical protein NDU88_011271 [Pleurodeles waltl]|uniref:Borealin C-terminal domain-containing protein n=1 Tax=Pleurodeles waltl TaxID=8319 RepID=A0AAV7S6F4_PLEWA|nr:hypothetical protein NDU88_011271 [Pleurodeles waltl]